jgi:hypothetical protein
MRHSPPVTDENIALYEAERRIEAEVRTQLQVRAHSQTDPHVEITPREGPRLSLTVLFSDADGRDKYVDFRVELDRTIEFHDYVAEVAIGKTLQRGPAFIVRRGTSAMTVSTPEQLAIAALHLIGHAKDAPNE